MVGRGGLEPPTSALSVRQSLCRTPRGQDRNELAVLVHPRVYQLDPLQCIELTSVLRRVVDRLALLVMGHRHPDPSSMSTRLVLESIELLDDRRAPSHQGLP